MPSFPVHLAVADILCESAGVTSKSDFFLGSIAPDSVNLKGFASQEIRYKAHIRSVNYDLWKKQLKEFYTENLDAFSERLDFLKGYVFHCVTDIAWDEAVQPQLFEFLQKEGTLSREEITRLKWEELFRFNSLVMKHEHFVNAVTLLEAANPMDIASVTAQQISDYRDYVVGDYKDKISDEKPLFLCMEHIEICARRTLELFLQLTE